MSHQKPWNQFEMALLIECYINVTGKGRDLEEELVVLSQTLRKMALSAGEQIDGVYRNINGMHWQYQFIKMAIENPNGAMHR